jgi:phenylacetate-coenzyme A ligase PaaK-like adenylate-forming protein
MNRPVFQTRWPQLPEAALCRWQAQRLRHYLRHVVLPFASYYRDQFREQGLDADAIRTLKDLQRLPFTTKADLQPTPEFPERPREFVLIPDRHVLARRPGTLVRAAWRGRARVERELSAEYRPIMLNFTAGRSAEPLPIMLTQHDVDNLQRAGLRLMEICGANPDWRMLNAFPFAPHLAFWLTHHAGAAFGAFMVSSGGGKTVGTEGNLRFLRRFHPDVLVGMPTFIYHLLHAAAEAGGHCENLKRIVLGGEKVSDGLRRKLRDLARELGAPPVDVLATYGFSEAKQAWAECPFPHDEPSAGYHLYPDLGIVEIIDPRTGEVVPSGSPGEIVFTPLDARGTVVLRYRTGDYIDGGLTYEPCPHCHRTLPRLVGKISRSSEFRSLHLDKLKGTLVDFNQLEHVLDDDPHVGAWQLELRKLHDDPHELDELILHVHRINGDDDARVADEISERFLQQTELHPNRIEFHGAEAMRRLQGVGVLLKEQQVVDHRPGANGAGGAVPGGARVAGSPDAPIGSKF